MTIPQILFPALLLATVYSCNNSTANKPETVIKSSNVTDTTAAVSMHANDTVETTTYASSTDEDTIADIKFPQLSVSINRLLVYDEGKQLNNIQTDTVYLGVELGETIEAQKITVTSELLTNITVEQRYETSVSISEEGPHCDMLDWKHYYSEWKPLNQNAAGQFIAENYTEKENQKFPEIPLNEFKEAVKQHCGEGGFELVKKNKSIKEGASIIGISNYFLRISGKRKDNGELVTKIIIIDSPMGC
jgi:hypothetical protein